MMDKLNYKLEVKFDTGTAEVLVNMLNVELMCELTTLLVEALTDMLVLEF